MIMEIIGKIIRINLIEEEEGGEGEDHIMMKRPIIAIITMKDKISDINIKEDGKQIMIKANIVIEVDKVIEVHIVIEEETVIKDNIVIIMIEVNIMIEHNGEERVIEQIEEEKSTIMIKEKITIETIEIILEINIVIDKIMDISKYNPIKITTIKVNYGIIAISNMTVPLNNIDYC